MFWYSISLEKVVSAVYHQSGENLTEMDVGNPFLVDSSVN